MFRPLPALVALLLAAGARAEPVEVAPGVTLIPGNHADGRQPDGNSVLVDAPDGLILIDTGRHPEHQDAIIALARARGKPVAAIVNTHWHLDHSGGNAEIRAAYPGVPLHASDAIEGALRGFLPNSRANAERYLASGDAPQGIRADIALDIAAIDDPASLRPAVPVTSNKTLRLAGRKMDVRLAPFAATEGDVWLFEPATKTVIAGDLVVAAAPYLDTACPEGWRKALDEIAARDFRMLIPGHGNPMDRAQFLDWRKAFANLLDCAAGDAPDAMCIAGWKRDAAGFIPSGESRIDAMIGYYLKTRLRAAPDERARYCKPQ